MLSLLKIGIEPSAPIADSITFFTALRHLQSIRTDSTPAVEKIKDLLSTPKDRLYGLILLKIALEQNTDVYVKGNWPVVLYEILNDSVAPNLKEYACELFCMLLPFMTKEATVHAVELRKFSKEVFPFLIDQVQECVEWSKAALKCIHTCLKVFPQSLTQHKDHLLSIILRKASFNVSSEVFEIAADCFAEFPNLLQVLTPDSYLDEWKKQYMTTLNTLHQLLSVFLPHDPFARKISKIHDAAVYVYWQDGSNSKDDVFQAYTKTARRFINFSRCLAKMLSTQSRFSVEIPVKATLVLITRLFDPQSIKNIKPVGIESQVFYSFLSQMQLAALLVFEPLLVNLDVLPYSVAIADLVQDALETSRLENIAVETVSVIRVAIWKILKMFLKKYGSSVSGDIMKRQDNIFQHLFTDINIEDKKPESLVSQASPKSKKTVPNLEKKKCVSENTEEVCKEALEAFEQLIYSGSYHISKERYKESFSKILQTSFALHMSANRFPSPYKDELCRKNLYSVLLSLALIAHVDQHEFANSAVGILKHAFQDPSIEVTGFCNIAMAMLNAKIHPKRLPLKLKQRSTKVSSAVIKCSEWTSSDGFISNIPLENALKVHENITSRSARTFHDPDEGAGLQEEPMDESVAAIEEVMGAEPHYPESYGTECYPSKYHEQGVENHHNGDDVLEINSSQGQEEESDEEDEEDEDEDRSCGDEEMNQEDVPPENMYILSTSKLQVANPVHISPETVSRNVSDREYEQLRPCMKAETSNVDSNKNMHLNGVRSIVPDGDVPSSSTQPSLANENGVFMYDDEELEEEEEGEEEEEEESAPYPAEKRVPVSCPPNPPSKRQKLDSDEPKIETTEDEGPRSPTLEEMKADFHCTEIEDVKS